MDHIDRFVVVKALTRSRRGVVLEAHDPRARRDVALEVIGKPTRRILGEVQALSGLNHPNVMPPLDVVVCDDGLLVAWPLREGAPDGQKHPERPWRNTLQMYVEAGRGLAAAHAAGLVHRRFGPEAMVLGGDGQARVLFAPLRTHASVLAPEVALGGLADEVSDQYSFCAALWEALYGQPPAADNGRDAPPRPLSAVPGEIYRALARGLSPCTVDRFASMDELLGKLSKTGRGRRWAGVGVGVAGVVLAALAQL